MAQRTEEGLDRKGKLHCHLPFRSTCSRLSLLLLRGIHCQLWTLTRGTPPRLPARLPTPGSWGRDARAALHGPVRPALGTILPLAKSTGDNPQCLVLSLFTSGLEPRPAFYVVPQLLHTQFPRGSDTLARGRPQGQRFPRGLLDQGDTWGKTDPQNLGPVNT